MPKVLIVDDHAIVRSGLRNFLHDDGDSYLVREAATGQEALDLCRAEHWDVVLLDITLPGLGGEQVLQQLRQDCPGLPVLMLLYRFRPSGTGGGSEFWDTPSLIG